MGKSVKFGLLIPGLCCGLLVNGTSSGWSLVQNGTTGIVALEAMVVSPTLVLMFDRAENNPLMINNHSAWGALWNLETNTASPVDLITDSFCASGSFLSNGTMASRLINLPIRLKLISGRLG